MPHLAIQNPDGDKRLNLDDQPVTIGRGRENIVVISHKHVSRRHCVIERHDDSFQLRDLGSLSGTMVNGQSISIISLSDSDRIQIGPFDLWFYDSEPTEDMPAQDGDAASAVPADDSPTGADVDPKSLSPLGESGIMTALEDVIDIVDPESKTSIEPISDPTSALVPDPEAVADAAALDALRAEHDRIENDLKGRIDTLEQEHAATQAANQESTARIEALTTTLETKEKELQTLQGEIEQRHAELNEKDDALSDLRQDQTADQKKLTEANHDLEDQVTGLREQIKLHDDEIKRTTGEVEEEKQTLDKQRTELEKLDKKLKTKTKKQEREEEKLSTRLKDQKEKKKHLQERLGLLEQEVENRSKEIEAREAESEKYITEQRSRLEQTEGDLESKREKLDLEQLDLDKGRESLATQLEQMQAEWKQHEERAATLVDELLTDQRAELEKRQDELAKEHEANETTHDELEAKDGELKKNHSELEQKLEEAAVSRQALNDDQNKLEHDRMDLREFEEKLGRRRDMIKSDRARIEQEFKELKANQAALEKQRKSREEEFAARLGEAEALQKELDALKETLSEEASQIELRSREIESDRNALEAEQRDTNAKFESERAILGERKLALEDDRRELDTKIEIERKELAASMEETDRQLKLRETEQTQRKKTLERLQAELETKQASVTAERLHCEEMQSECERQKKDLDERAVILDLQNEEMRQKVADAETKMGQFHRQSDVALKALDSNAERITQLISQIAELKRELANSSFDQHNAADRRQEDAQAKLEFLEKSKQLEAVSAQVATLQQHVSQYQTAAANAGDLANQAYRVLNIMRNMVERLHDSLDRCKALQANLDEKSKVLYGLTRNISCEYRLERSVQEDLKKQRETIQAELQSLQTQNDETMHELFENVHRICALSMLRRTELPQPPGIPAAQATATEDPPDNSPSNDQ